MTTKSIVRSAIWWTLAAAWATVIFLFSAQNATESSSLSNSVVDWLIAVLGLNITTESLSGIIRSLAHFSAFGLLGILTAGAVRSHRLSKHRCLWIPFAICVGYAVTDEFHQWFVPGRSMQLSDILVDSSGALLGILAVALIARLLQKRKKRTTQ